MLVRFGVFFITYPTKAKSRKLVALDEKEEF